LERGGNALAKRLGDEGIRVWWLLTRLWVWIGLTAIWGEIRYLGWPLYLKRCRNRDSARSGMESAMAMVAMELMNAWCNVYHSPKWFWLWTAVLFAFWYLNGRFVNGDIVKATYLEADDG
jgi:hypothetical protein